MGSTNSHLQRAIDKQDLFRVTLSQLDRGVDGTRAFPNPALVTNKTNQRSVTRLFVPAVIQTPIQ